VTSFTNLLLLLLWTLTYINTVTKSHYQSPVGTIISKILLTDTSQKLKFVAHKIQAFYRELMLQTFTYICCNRYILYIGSFRSDSISSTHIYIHSVYIHIHVYNILFLQCYVHGDWSTSQLDMSPIFSHFFVGCFESSRQICQLLWKQPTKLCYILHNRFVGCFQSSRQKKWLKNWPMNMLTW
jgi:hypothetical protein